MEASQNARLLRRKERDASAQLAQIPFDFAQGRLSLRNERLLGMTNQTEPLPVA